MHGPRADPGGQAALAAAHAVTAPPTFLSFRSYSIAFHLTGPLSPARGADGSDTEERALRSYERDMLLYSHRDAPPFETHILSNAPTEVSVRLPPQVTYEAEGKRQTVRYPGVRDAGRSRSFAVLFADTRFPASNLSVRTIVLEPLQANPAYSELNEYDVITLIKLWEGGETVFDAPSIVEGRDIWFETGDRKWTLDELGAAVFQGPRRPRAPTTRVRRLRTGTVELRLAPAGWHDELFADITALQEAGEAPEDLERWNRAVALGGIIQGLLDFRRIKPDELADVFAAVAVDAEAKSLLGFHKGALISVWANEHDEPSVERDEARGSAGQEDEQRRPPPIGVDAYLAIPNIVLLHNEHRLKTARARPRSLLNNASVSASGLRSIRRKTG